MPVANVSTERWKEKDTKDDQWLTWFIVTLGASNFCLGSRFGVSGASGKQSTTNDRTTQDSKLLFGGDRQESLLPEGLFPDLLDVAERMLAQIL